MKARFKHRRSGFVLLEVLLALAILAGVVTSFALALKQVAQLSEFGRREAEIQRILDSALTDAAMLPILEAESYSYTLEEMGGIDVEILIEPIEDLESEEGQLLAGMMRIEVLARFDLDDEKTERRAETWRYTRLYQ